MLDVYDMESALPYEGTDEPIEGYSTGVLSADGLFDQDPEDVILEYDFRPTTDWDNEFNKRLYREHTEDDFIDPTDVNSTKDMSENDIALSAIRYAAWFTRESMGFHKEQNKKTGKQPYRSRFGAGLVQDYASLELDYADRFQEVFLGLLAAAKKNDPKKGKYLTLAAWYAESSLVRASQVKGSKYDVHIPIGVQEVMQTINREIDNADCNGDLPNIDKISAITGVPKNEVEVLAELSAMHRAHSLDVITDYSRSDENDEDIGIADRITDDRIEINHEEFLTIAGVNKFLDTNFEGTIDDREATIIDLAMGLSGNQPMTYREIGSFLGFSRSRIGQIYHRSLAKIRGFLFAAQTDNFEKLGYWDETINLHNTLRPEVRLTEEESIRMGAEGYKTWDRTSASSVYRPNYRKNPEKWFEYQEDWSD